MTDRLVTEHPAFKSIKTRGATLILAELKLFHMLFVISLAPCTKMSHSKHSDKKRERLSYA